MGGRGREGRDKVDQKEKEAKGRSWCQNKKKQNKKKEQQRIIYIIMYKNNKIRIIKEEKKKSHEILKNGTGKNIDYL